VGLPMPVACSSKVYQPHYDRPGQCEGSGSSIPLFRPGVSNLPTSNYRVRSLGFLRALFDHAQCDHAWIVAHAVLMIDSRNARHGLPGEEGKVWPA
jgi:hypothetical protein